MVTDRIRQGGKLKRVLIVFLALGVVGAFFVASFVAGAFSYKTGYIMRVADKYPEVQKFVDFGRSLIEGDRSSQKEDSDVRVVHFETKSSVLHDFEIASFKLERFLGAGGAIVQIRNHIAFATPKGRLGYVSGGAGRSSAVRIAYSDVRVPMNLEDFRETVFAKNPLFKAGWVRVAGLLAVPGADGGGGALYVSHHRVEGECIRFDVSRINYTADTAEIAFAQDGWQRVYSAEPCIPLKEEGNVFAGLQAGGRMSILPDGRLLLLVGEHEFDGVHHALRASQDASVDLGKAVAIDLTTGEASHFATGMRNPQGLVQARDGTLWATEHGPRGGDEINLIEQGSNYGWPEVSYGALYGFPTQAWPLNPEPGRHGGHVKPRFAFVPSIAISAIDEYDGDEFPNWQGDLIFGSLGTQTLYRARREGREIRYVEPLIELGERVRDALVLEDGRIALLTDSARIYIMRRYTPDDPADVIQVSGYEAAKAASERASQVFSRADARGEVTGEAVFADRCASCHSLIEGTHLVGPHLADLLGRDIGGAEDYAYSEALKSADGTWTAERLRDFLAEPDKNFEGTTMPRSTLTGSEIRQVVDYLSGVAG